MVNFLTVLIALICVLLMLVVLIQNPKGGGVDSTFGGQGANQMFGAAKSSDFIEKLTWGLAAALFLMCIITVLVVNGQSIGATDIPLQSQQ
jgi:preprotein translocase subunit SecG